MTRISRARFAEMVEEATVDCYNDSEKVTGWFTIIDDNLVVPFEASLSGIVTDQSTGNPLSGISVAIFNNSTSQKSTATTDSSGDHGHQLEPPALSTPTAPSATSPSRSA